MKRFSVTQLGPALALLVAAAGARADQIAPAGPPTVTATAAWQPNLVRAYAAGSDFLVTPLDHYLSFSKERAHPIDVPTQFAPPGSGPTQVLATNLDAVTSATIPHPDKALIDYTLALVLTGSQGPYDTASLSFPGRLSATFFNAGGPDGLPHTYLDAQNQYTGLTTQTATLDGNTITVALDPLVQPMTGSTNHGSISAEVTADIAGAGPGPDPAPGPPGAPEPSTLVLSFLGVTVLAAASLRECRVRAAG
jgi:hypothetical protein